MIFNKDKLVAVLVWEEKSFFWLVYFGNVLFVHLNYTHNVNQVCLTLCGDSKLCVIVRPASRITVARTVYNVELQ